MFQRQSLYQLCLSAIPVNKRTELNNLIAKCSDEKTIIQFLVDNNAKFSLNSLLMACNNGTGKSVKNLFLLAKRNPLLKPALPHINATDEDGNTLLHSVLLQFINEMHNYIQKVYAISHTEFSGSIPGIVSQEIQTLQNLQLIIKYLLIENASEDIQNSKGITARTLFNQAKKLLDISDHYDPQLIVPLKNMLQEIERNRLESTTCYTHFNTCTLL